MEPIYKFTKKQLINAFEKWDKDYLANPDNYKEPIEKRDAKEQAEQLLKFLEEI